MVSPMMTPYGYPSHWYHCLLDEQPYYLAPERLLAAPPPPDAALVVNPHCWFSWHGPLPPDKAARTFAAEHIFPAEGLVWVDDPATRAIWPYSVGREYLPYVAALAPGMPAPALPPHVLWVLWQAGILVGANHTERRRRSWLDVLSRANKSFERGFASVEKLIPPFHLGALRRYYRFHGRAGSFVLGDDQVSTRLAAHNEPIARFFHYQLGPAMSDVASTLVMPSYAYMVAYQEGSELERHTDREQCEYSITLCLDSTPEPEAQAPWPIHLDLPEGALRIWQYVGDALLYRGRHLPHYRDRLPDGYTATSLLFHYVDEGFSSGLS
jgi:hypothetical protein